MGKQIIKNIEDVRDWRLCVGCGACASRCDQQAIHLENIEDFGIRPFIDNNQCEDCRECLDVCPAYMVRCQAPLPEAIAALKTSWGSVLEVWEGYACDPDIRFLASSGGVISAISQYCMEQEQCSGTLHIQDDPKVPWGNIPVYSHTKEDLLKGSGSRYAPAAVCQAFHLIQKAEHQSVFVGKPCDVAALRKYQSVKSDFREKVHCAISLFCAGTPSIRATFDLLDILEIDPEEVKQIRYRGKGWPGSFRVSLVGENVEDKTMSYREAWDHTLTPKVQWGCRLCPDHTGETADISCGDPWYRTIDPKDSGQSLILIRSEQGKRIFQQAMEKNYIYAERRDPNIVAQSQISILKNRRHLYGRLLALRLLGIPSPQFEGFHLKENFSGLPFSEKLRSFIGTVRRVLKRGYRKPISMESH